MSLGARGLNECGIRKFTPETALKIVQFVSAGCFIETAAGAAGLNKSTLYEWMKRGENRKDPRSTEELRAWKKLLDEAAATSHIRAAAGIGAGRVRHYVKDKTSQTPSRAGG